MTAAARIRNCQVRILEQLDSLLEVARDTSLLELRREQVSTWSVGEQLRHVTLVDEGILKQLEKTEPPAELAGRGPTVMGRCLLRLGFIPRGGGKAPSAMIPRQVRPDQIEPDLTAVRERFAALDPGSLAASGPLSRHPVFGHLDGAQWLRFADIHQHHHWKIIRDIRRAAA